MAFRAMSNWRSMVTRLGANRSFASSTASSSADAGNAHRSHSKYAITGEFAPVYMVGGLLLVAISMGAHTMKQQLMHSPAVSIRKKRRGSIEEIDDPDRVVDSADKLINKSFLRKVAHIQDDTKPTLPDHSRPNPFTKPRNAETLKTVGVDRKGN